MALPGFKALSMAGGENPKSVLRKAAAASPAWQDHKLSEDRPGEIAKWCERVRQADPGAAVRMLNPLIRLNYGECDDQIVELVEATLYFAVFQQERPAARHAEDASANAA